MCSNCSTLAYEWDHPVFGFLFLCQFAENEGFQLHPCPCKGHKYIRFCGGIVFHGVCATFSLSSLLLMDIWVGSRSLLLWTVPQWTYVCVCLHNRTIYNSLGIYPVMVLLGQTTFLFLDPWGTVTVSSTMAEQIYTPTNVIKVFLFLDILSSICGLQIF